MFANVTLSLMGGFVTTVQLFCLTLVFAPAARLLISFGSMSRITPLRALIKIIVWIVRGTPLMLQIIIIFYGPALLWDISLPRFTAALVAFVINYACYFSEIFRGGIQGIPSGQYEAGQVLGMTKSQIFFKVTLLQVIKRVTRRWATSLSTLLKIPHWRVPSRYTRCCGWAKSSSRAPVSSGRCSTPPYSTCCSTVF